jgi:hypothetical protein
MLKRHILASSGEEGGQPFLLDIRPYSQADSVFGQFEIISEQMW